jgi:pimeloyl-ACP methyl ester carboxylesterase
MPTATSGTAAIHYATHGASGDPVVLVHGSFEDATTWDRVVAGFASALAVVTYDRRGYGESPAVPTGTPVAEDVADLVAVLEAADRFPAHVIGHAYGGSVAIALARERPDLVRSVLVHEPPFYGLLEWDPATATEAVREMEQIRELSRRGDPAAAAQREINGPDGGSGVWEQMTAPERSRSARYFDRWREEVGDPATFAPDPAALGETLLPVLASYGEESPAIDRRIAEALGAQLPYARLQRLPECGHAPHRTHPELFVAVLGTFLLERDVPPT